MTATREIPFGRPWIPDSDKERVMRVLSGHILTHGPECKAFEQEFGAFIGPDTHAVSMSSCMAALHLSYVHLGVGPGDEVIAPALTHVATVHAIEWVGAKPIFVDCNPHTGNLEAEDIAAAITPRTKAITLVHFVGIPANMPAIVEVAKKHDLKIVEDCAIALGARWDGKHVGMFGDVGCFSFYPVKHITTGEGGMLISRHEQNVDAIAKLRAFGVDRTHSERAIPGFYEVPQIGLNYRMSEMQAALGRGQMTRIVENLAERRRNFDIIAEGIRGDDAYVLDSTDPAAKQSHYCAVLVLPHGIGHRRNEIVAKINAAGIGTSIYYPQPVPRMKLYREKYGYDGARYPNASRLSDYALALPVGHHVSVEDAQYIAKTVRRIIEEEMV